MAIFIGPTGLITAIENPIRKQIVWTPYSIPANTHAFSYANADLRIMLQT